MKKYFILTSLLSLTACFGGGGSGGGSGGGAGAPAGVHQAITPDSAAAQSNALVTSMASEILVASDGSVATPSLSRAATQSYYNGKTYTAYRLDDVVFKIGGEDSQIKFEVDDKGQIIALTKMDRSDDFSGEPTYAKSQEGTFTRTSSTSKDFSKSLFIYGYNLNTDNDPSSGLVREHFGGDLQIMDDSADLASWQIKQKVRDYINKETNKIKKSQPSNAYDEKIEAARAYYLGQVDDLSFDTPEEVHATVTAEGVKIGLKYADLGFAELTVKDNTDKTIEEHNYSPYVGGYGALKVDPSKLSKDTSFSGTAIAGLDHKVVVNNHTTVKEGVLVRDDNATLTMHSDGASELVMDNLKVDTTSDAGLMGKKWYNVTAKQNADGTPTFIVTGTNAITGYNLPSGTTTTKGVTFAPSEFRPIEQEYSHNIDGENPGEGTRYGGNMETAMYGPNSAASEATARFGFSNEVYSNSNADHQEVAIYGAFGGTKQ